MIRCICKTKRNWRCLFPHRGTSRHRWLVQRSRWRKRHGWIECDAMCDWHSGKAEKDKAKMRRANRVVVVYHDAD